MRVHTLTNRITGFFRNVAAATPLVIIFMSGCAHMGPVADGVSTQAALQAGAVEANPLLAGGDPVALAISVGVRHAYIEGQRGQPNCTESVGFMNSFAWGAAGNNLLVAAVGAAPAVAIPVGIVFGVAHNKLNAERTRQWCYPDYPSCSLADLPDGAASAQCVRGELVVTSWDGGPLTDPDVPDRWISALGH